jgi:hypothetical protein
MRLEDLRDGQELVGTVFRQMLYHGAQIDIGCEYDGRAQPRSQWLIALTEMLPPVAAVVHPALHMSYHMPRFANFWVACMEQNMAHASCCLTRMDVCSVSLPSVDWRTG